MNSSRPRTLRPASHHRDPSSFCSQANLRFENSGSQVYRRRESPDRRNKVQRLPSYLTSEPNHFLCSAYIRILEIAVGVNKIDQSPVVVNRIDHFAQVVECLGPGAQERLRQISGHRYNARCEVIAPQTVLEEIALYPLTAVALRPPPDQPVPPILLCHHDVVQQVRPKKARSAGQEDYSGITEIHAVIDGGRRLNARI